jgi:hypothetical protein
VFFLDFLNGGAWPLLVGGVICLVDSVNGRDPSCPVGTKIVIEDSDPLLDFGQVADILWWVPSLQDSRLCAW